MRQRVCICGVRPSSLPAKDGSSAFVFVCCQQQHDHIDLRGAAFHRRGVWVVRCACSFLSHLSWHHCQRERVDAEEQDLRRESMALLGKSTGVWDGGGRSTGVVDLTSESDSETTEQRCRNHALRSREPVSRSWQPALRSRVLVVAICTVSLPIFELGQIGAHRC